MKLTHRRITIRLRHRFATSQGGVDSKQVILTTFEHDGVRGYGEAVPSRLYGQTLESSEAVIDDCAAQLGNDPFAVETTMRRLIDRHDGQRAALAAVDSALHDWIGRRLGIPTWRFLGLPQPSQQTTFTLGVAEPAETRAKLDEALADGFTSLKVKVGTPRDEETLAIVRERFDGPLLLDANEAWSADEAEARMRGLARFRPAMIEQPVRREEWQALGRLRDLRIAPLFVDEDCQRPRDIIRLHNRVDGVNIKFTKCGGIREALRMIHLARSLNLGVMVGCFVSSSLAIAPALCIAGLADFADLDGALLLADDPFVGIERRGAVLSLGYAPGLGVQPAGE